MNGHRKSSLEMYNDDDITTGGDFNFQVIKSAYLHIGNKIKCNTSSA